MFYSLTENPFQIDGVYLLGNQPVFLSNLWFVGLGGAPPVSFDNTYINQGHPYMNDEECDNAVTSLLLPQMIHSQFVLITHFPPKSIGFIENQGRNLSTGSQKLQEIVAENSNKIVLHVYGHLHSQHTQNDYFGVKVVNPGCLPYRNYATVTLQYIEKWEVKEIHLKSL